MSTVSWTGFLFNRTILLAGLFLTLAVVTLIVLPNAFATNELLPSADGNYLQWTPSTGSTHYTLVDEQVCNGTTDYNFTTTVGNRDSYSVSLASVPNAATITSIKITPCASRNSNGGANPVMNVFYRFNGVNSADAGAYSLTGTTPINLATTTFSSLSLVKSSTSTLEVGAVLTSSTKGARLSRMATVYTYTELLAPTHLTATSSATSTIMYLTWGDNATTEKGYAIHRALSASGPWTGLATTTVNKKTYHDLAITPGVTYYYRVQAYNAGGHTTFSNTASDTANGKPPAPSGLTANASGTSLAIDLGWTDNSSNETAFEIQRTTSTTTGPWINIATTTANTIAHTDQPLSANTEYYYRLRAYNSFGYSAFTSVASDTTGSLPVAPSGLGASSSATTTAIKLTWADNSSDETGFQIQRSLSASGPWTGLATTSPSTVSYTDTLLSQGVLYYYRVRAFNTFGYSGFSGTVSARAASKPNVPLNFQVTVSATSSSSQIDLSWFDNSSNEDGFQIFRSLDSIVWDGIATTSPNISGYSDTGLSPSTGYYYKIRAFNPLGYSAFSNKASATTTP
jgi:hypothetical protein